MLDGTQLEKREKHVPPVDLRSIKSFPQLIKYLRDELAWPIESSDFEDLFFEYSADELGLDSGTTAKIKEIKQLRPLESKQPWGIFFVNFEPQRLPVVALRRILRALVVKKRQSASRSQQATWQLHDLLFISTYGETNHRDITFAHFAEEPGQGDLPVLRVLGWDDEDTALHTAHTDKMLRERLCWPKDTRDMEKWRATWSSAFTLRHQQVIKTSKELALQLAGLAQRIRKRARAVLTLENEKGQLRKLYAAFKEALIHDLSEDDFADMYAQTISYGLLTARISRPSGIVADNLTDMVPVTNPFLKELLETFLNVGGRKGKIDFDELGISEVVQLLRDADMEAVLRDFDDRNPKEDPAIHFYELFLKEYDPQKRMQRGVFYTPRPVVSFIVRSIHELLQKEFGLADGLADIATWGETIKRQKALHIPESISPDAPFVTILDPATGTGTFLVEAIDVIYETMKAKWIKEGHMALELPNLWNQYVPKHLLPRLYGYELMMAPYAIAHMKIGLKLFGTGYRFASNERARVYLTNSLEPAGDDKKQRDFEEWAPALAHEAKAVNHIKRNEHFTVIVGNPPYSAASHNPSKSDQGELTHIGRLMRAYFEIEGVPLGERNPRWLQDDYVKFVRYCETSLTSTSIGVLGLITNHGYLANPTFRGMRHSLLSSFSSVKILDLHGNSKRAEKAEDGSSDENVFEIQQGVAISILCRAAKGKGEARVSHADLFGTRDSKYQRLTSSASVEFTQINPGRPFYLFIPQNEELRTEYDLGVSLADMFISSSVGIVTGRDSLTIHFTRQEAETVTADFASLSVEQARSKYQLGEDSRDWKVALAQKDLRISKISPSLFVPILYRPFDTRYTFYTGHSRGFHCMPRGENMGHMAAARNLGLLTARSNKSPTGDHFFCSRFITEAKAGEATTQSCLFPLYLYRKSGELAVMEGQSSNLRRTFTARLAAALGYTQAAEGELPFGLIADDIFNYAYAVFYSPAYRRRYAEFLKIDFPRLPLTSRIALFRTLGALGGQLVGMHLLESPKLDEPIAIYRGTSKPEIEKVSYARDTVWLDKAQTCGFPRVPEGVWNFQIGGYQVCEKWLKDRKGRTLSKDEIIHYQKIIVALSETIRIMAEIDKVIDAHGGWPGAFVTGQ